MQDGSKGGVAYKNCSRLTVKGVTLGYPPSQFQHTQGVVVDVGSPPVRAVTVQVCSFSNHFRLLLEAIMGTPCVTACVAAQQTAGWMQLAARSLFLFLPEILTGSRQSFSAQ